MQYDSIECALVHHLANKLANDSVTGGEWYKLFESVYRTDDGKLGMKLGEFIRADLMAVMDRDPACDGPTHALLNFKGFLGLQVRFSHKLLLRIRKGLLTATCYCRRHPG